MGARRYWIFRGVTNCDGLQKKIHSQRLHATEPGISSDIYRYEPVSLKASRFHHNDWLTPLLFRSLKVRKYYRQSKLPCVPLFELPCKATVEQKKVFTYEKRNMAAVLLWTSTCSNMAPMALL